jgi:hypothetical protein
MKGPCKHIGSNERHRNRRHRGLDSPGTATELSVLGGSFLLRYLLLLHPRSPTPAPQGCLQGSCCKVGDEVS